MDRDGRGGISRFVEADVEPVVGVRDNVEDQPRDIGGEGPVEGTVGAVAGERFI